MDPAVAVALELLKADPSALLAEVVKLRARVDELERQAEPEPVLKLDEERRIVHGWGYVRKRRNGEQVVDVSGDLVEDDRELEDAAYAYVRNSRNGRANHTGDPVATLVESAVFTEEKLQKMGVPTGVLPVGWWVGYHVHDDQVWADVKAGKLKAFSIGGRGRRVPIS